MGDYQLLRDSGDDSTGILRTVDNAVIPPDSDLGAWNDYLAWKAVPNNPDPAVAAVLTDYQENAKSIVDQQLEEQLMANGFQVRYQLNPCAAAAEALMYEEAIAQNKDGATPVDATRFPILEELTNDGAAIADRATTLIAEWNGGGAPTLASRTGQLLRTKRQAFVDIDAAANQNAVDVVIAALTWPVV